MSAFLDAPVTKTVSVSTMKVPRKSVVVDTNELFEDEADVAGTMEFSPRSGRSVVKPQSVRLPDMHDMYGSFGGDDQREEEEVVFSDGSGAGSQKKNPPKKVEKKNVDGSLYDIYENEGGEDS